MLLRLACAVHLPERLLDPGMKAEHFAEPSAPVPTYPLWRYRRR